MVSSADRNKNNNPKKILGFESVLLFSTSCLLLDAICAIIVITRKGNILNEKLKDLRQFVKINFI